MIDKVIETIQKYELFHKGDRVVAGVSGGADSVALLHFLAEELPEYKLDITVCHLNHLLRGEESERDEAFVRALCERLGVSCRVRRLDIASLAAEKKQGLEECGREERYRFFEETAASLDENTVIATAHTLSDQTETVLFRLARGSGLKGLCGIPPKRGKIVRPFLEITREEVEAYCFEKELPFVTDSSNLEAVYARNLIRLETIPTLKKVNPSLEKTLAETVEDLREDDRFLWETAARKLTESDEEEGYRLAVFRSAPRSIRRRMLILACRENGCSPDREKIKEFDQIIEAGHGKINMSGMVLAEVQKERLAFSVRSEAKSFPPFPLQEGVLTFPSGIAYNITAAPFDGVTQKVNRNFATDILDCDKILGNITVRPRQSGDCITLSRRGVTKSLKKLFNEAKIPVNERELQAVMADEKGVIWVEGFGADSRVLPSEETLHSLTICKFEQDSEEMNYEK